MYGEPYVVYHACLRVNIHWNDQVLCYILRLLDMEKSFVPCLPNSCSFWDGHRHTWAQVLGWSSPINLYYGLLEDEIPTPTVVDPHHTWEAQATGNGMDILLTLTNKAILGLRLRPPSP